MGTSLSKGFFSTNIRSCSLYLAIARKDFSIQSGCTHSANLRLLSLPSKHHTQSKKSTQTPQTAAYTLSFPLNHRSTFLSLLLHILGGSNCRQLMAAGLVWFTAKDTGPAVPTWNSSLSATFWLLSPFWCQRLSALESGLKSGLCLLVASSELLKTFSWALKTFSWAHTVRQDTTLSTEDSLLSSAN